MTLHAWRLVKKKHAATAFNGEGARLYGGRWNSPGTRLVYASSSRALAALESLVHLNPPVHFAYVAFSLRFTQTLVETLTPEDLPLDWRNEPASSATKAIGDRWVAQGRSAVLEVPSAVIPGESNFLFNPAHPGFDQVTIGPATPFAFDPRLL
jgi:RES domain-containing protein